MLMLSCTKVAASFPMSCFPEPFLLARSDIGITDGVRDSAETPP